jgi:drug/metabolite transporter (DMT)-like permease
MSQAGGRWKVLIGTVGVFAVYLYVLSTWTASAVSYEFVLAPLVAIVLAAWLLDEPVTRTFAAGSVMVVAGVYPGAIPPGARRRHRSQRPRAEAGEPPRAG